MKLNKFSWVFNPTVKKIYIKSGKTKSRFTYLEKKEEFGKIKMKDYLKGIRSDAQGSSDIFESMFRWWWG